ncbi:MAG: GNAT family N-acetyltransferase [Limimaricola soesokkakensis]|uniref:GNAT family N-acetyltransferase n=1 Tax=Limimaricola soesokkakensis TaxID=1343159 RepID=UPI00405A3382
MLLADAERRIALSGHDEAWLTVVLSNDPARGFYERHGWRRDGPATIEIEHGSRPDVLYLWRFAKSVTCLTPVLGGRAVAPVLRSGP